MNIRGKDHQPLYLTNDAWIAKVVSPVMFCLTVLSMDTVLNA